MAKASGRTPQAQAFQFPAPASEQVTLGSELGLVSGVRVPVAQGSLASHARRWPQCRCSVMAGLPPPSAQNGALDYFLDCGKREVRKGREESIRRCPEGACKVEERKHATEVPEVANSQEPPGTAKWLSSGNNGFKGHGRKGGKQSSKGRGRGKGAPQTDTASGSRTFNSIQKANGRPHFHAKDRGQPAVCCRFQKGSLPGRDVVWS